MIHQESREGIGTTVGAEHEERPEIRLERKDTGGVPKAWRHALLKVGTINSKGWADTGIKPIRNVPKESQAQHRAILSDLLSDYAESVRQSDLVSQRRLEKTLILLQILLHSPPDRGGIPRETPTHR